MHPHSDSLARVPGTRRLNVMVLADLADVVQSMFRSVLTYRRPL